MNYIEPGWISHIRLFLDSIGASITNTIDKPTLHRLNDSYIMDQFNAHNLTAQSMQHLYRARLFLQVARVSDIATPDGTRISPEWFEIDGIYPSNSKL